MSFQIFWTEDSEKDLEGLDDETAQRIIRKIEQASEYPYHFLDMLKGYSYYKLRIGDYRAIMDLDKDKEKLTVMLVAHRNRVYKKLQRKL